MDRIKKINKSASKSSATTLLKAKSTIFREFCVPNSCKRQISASISKNVRKLKLKDLKQNVSTELIATSSRSVTSKDFRQFAEKCPHSEMSRFEEKLIRQKINAKNLEKLYPQIINDLIYDTKLEYKKITHYAGINLKLKDKYPAEGFQMTKLKYKGRTENYDMYLLTRQYVKTQWILHDLVVRKIKEECVTLLPNKLFQIEFIEAMELSDLILNFNEKIELASTFLKDFAENISSSLIDINGGRSSSNNFIILKVTTGIFSIHVSQCVVQTLKTIVDFSTCFNIKPYLKISAESQDNLILKPTCEEVIKAFFNFIDKLISCIKELRLVERKSKKIIQHRKIFLCLTLEFLDECKRNISENIKQLFLPVEKYIKSLGNDFMEISNAIQSFDSNSYIVQYAEGCQQLEYYKNFTQQIANIPNNEYFNIGILSLRKYRETLYDSLQLIIDSIFDHLSGQHFNEVQDICDKFKLIEKRATQLPANTEELMEIGKFMNCVKDEDLDSLVERVSTVVQSLSSIINLGFLSKEHMAFNAMAVNWIDKISPIIEQHTINYEQLKFEAEENLQKVIEDISVLISDAYPLLSVLDDMDDIKLARKYLAAITLQINKIKEIQKKIEWINQEEIYLNFPPSTYPEFDDLKDYLFPFYHLLRLSLTVQRYESVWLDGQFDALEYNEINEKVEKLNEELMDMQKIYRYKLRQAQDENLPIQFKGTIDDPDISNWPAPLKICAHSLKILENFKPSLEIMRIMCNKSLCTRHWKAMSKIAGFNITPNAGTTLSKLIKMDLQEKIAEYEFISLGATKEQELLNDLNTLKSEWDNIKFNMTEITEINILIITNLQEILAIVDDQLTKLTKMEESVFAKANEKEISIFYQELKTFHKVLNNWGTIQEKYLQLRPIFQSPEAFETISKENEMFTFCKTLFIEYSGKILNSPTVRSIISQTNIKNDLEICLKHFEEITKVIENYIDLRRLKFPRLYFLADNELIELLATNINEISKNALMRIFPGFSYIKLEGNKLISRVVSTAGEELTLDHPIRCDVDRVEIFNLLLEEISKSLKCKLGNCCKIFRKKSIEELMEKYPQQVLQLAAQIFWTEKIQNALNLSNKINFLLFKSKLASHISQKMSLISDKKTNNLQRILLKNLLLTDLNNQYIFNNLLDQGSNIHADSFQWQIQLKYHIQQNECTIKWMNKSLNYGWEYFGNDESIIITPETERCYRSLLQTYHYHFHGLLRGKYETGKSEVIAGLAKALGIFYFNFTCSEYCNLSTILAFLKGTIQSGCWMILENFECLNLQIQSILQRSFSSITEAKNANVKKLHLDMIDFHFNPQCFISIITRNRNELKMPENFKILFRTFTFSTPDLQMFAKLILTCQGYEHAAELSRTISTCFNLLKNTLSNQACESFNLKDLKYVLAVFEKERQLSKERDIVLICRCIKNYFLARFCDSDRILFEQIMNDIFQDNNAVVSVAGAEQIYNFIQQICNEMHLQFNSVANLKIYDLQIVLSQNRNAILVGDCFSGKSTCLKVAIKSLERVYNNTIICHFINSTCMEYPELIGKIAYSEQSLPKWTDGILMKILRNLQEEKQKTIIIFDGYMDAIWIENIQWLLKDRKIFLENGGMFNYDTKNVNFVFETLDLRHFSPSMLFYCTTIYFPSNSIDYTSLINNWLETCKFCWLEEYKSHIEMLLLWFIPPCLENLQQTLTNYNQISHTSIKNALIYFEIILDNAVVEANHKKEDELKNLPTWIHASLVQAGVLGFYNIIVDQYQQQAFDQFYKKLWRGQIDEHPYPNGLERLEVSIPHDGNLLDYFYLYKQRGAWKQWSDVLKHEKISESLMVPTVDSLRCKFLLELHIRYEKKLLIIGPKSSGKSTIVNDYFNSNLNETEYEKSVLLLRHSTTPKSLQELILSKLTKNIHGNYAPSSKKRFICFLEDLHVPLKANVTCELLRQHFNGNAWYNVNSLEKCCLEKTSIIASTTVDDAFVRLPVRFSRHFNILAINKYSDETLLRIYSQILLNVWKKAGFSADITTAVNQIVNITLIVYKFIREHFKANALKNHYYFFDLASFSKVIQGCSCLRKDTYDGNKKIYIKLWIHEVFRVFGDRLDTNDKITFTNQLEDIVREQCAESLEEIFPNCQSNLPLTDIFFGTIRDLLVENDLRHYEEVNLQDFSNICTQYLTEYNSKSKFKLDLVLFDYSLRKLLKICRILSMPGENGLLLGLTGYGRQSLVKLASFIYTLNFISPDFINEYNLDYWNEVFKKVLQDCGTASKQTVFFASEPWIVDDNCLDIIDYYVREGQIIDLYSTEEKRNILELSRLSAQGGNRNLDISSHAVYSHFNKICRENLHIFISLNVDTEMLRRNLFIYTSLMSKLNLILWTDWPNNALEAIGSTWMKEVNLPTPVTNDVIKIGTHLHRTSQKMQQLNFPITPTAYIHLMKLFCSLIATQQNQLTEKKQQFVEGLEKLSNASNQIKKMQNSLTEYEPQLEAMKKNAAEMTKEISILTIEMEKATELVKSNENITNHQAEIVEDFQSDYKTDLAQAIPILEDAISALNTLKPADIAMVKSMKNPPDAVKLVMASVCVIKEVKPEKVLDTNSGRKIIDYWTPSKRILSDANLLQSLKDFDHDNIKPEIINKLRRDYISHKDFKPQLVGKASSAAECLCKWIIAMDMYDRIAKGVAPKKAKLDQAEKEYADAMQVLNEKREDLLKIDIKLVSVRAKLSEVKLKQRKLQREVNECNKKLIEAQKLLNGFNDEKHKWNGIVKHLQKQYDQLAGDVILASATIVYLSSLDHSSRSGIKQQWKDYIMENYNIPLELSDSFLVGLNNKTKENNRKLPVGQFFLENVAIYRNSKHFPVYLDPHEQAVNWIAKIEKKNNIVITKFGFSSWLQQLKEAISYGRPILIKDTEQRIPLCLNYLLFNQIHIVDNEQYVQLDQDILKIHKNFKLYLVCLKLDPFYNSEQKNWLTLINFSVTKEALVEKFLQILIDLENPQMKQFRKDFLKESKDNRKEFENLERRVLSTICASSPDILEDNKSMRQVEQLKQLTKSVKEKLESLRETQAIIEHTKSKYIGVAEYVADLFYCLKNFERLNPAYQTSFECYQSLYFTSILNAESYKILEIRCKKLCEKFTQELYEYVIKGVFEEHKLLFTFWLAIYCAKHKGQITDEMLLIFFEQKTFSKINENGNKPSDISIELWKNILNLEMLDTFKGISRSITDHIEVWKNFLELESMDIPTAWNNLDSFNKLILLKSIKPRKFHDGVIEFIKVSIGNQYLQSPILDMQQIYNQSYNLSLLLFILTPGVDILKILQHFAALKQVSHQFKHINLSDQSFKVTKEILLEMRKNGFWILIENCHLAHDYLFKLEQLLEEFNFENTHENFRLFLSCENTNGFPLEFLRNSIKIVKEQPRTLRKNLLEFYNNSSVFSDDFFYSSPGKQEIFSKLLYSLCYFHFVLLEHSRISNWNVPYKFKEIDVILSLKELQQIINENNNIFDSMYYLIGECIYNGYLDNSWSKMFLVEILQNCLNTSLLDKRKFLFSELKQYTLPRKSDRSAHVQHINQLPIIDVPDSLYLTQNELFAHQIKSQNVFLDSGLKIMGQYHPMKFETQTILTMIDDILTILPENINTSCQNKNEIISRELQLYGNLFQLIVESLTELRHNLNKQIGLSENIEYFMREFCYNSLPVLWQRRCYVTMLNMSSFIKDFCEKIKFMESIKEDNFWLGAFFYPRAFLVFLTRTYSRNAKISIENLSLDYEICTNINKAEKCTIYGLYLVGAQLGPEGKLEILPESQRYGVLPSIQIKPTLSSATNGEKCRIECYVFRTEFDNQSRNVDRFLIKENYLMKISLNSDLDGSYWIKKGIRIVCEIV